MAFKNAGDSELLAKSADVLQGFTPEVYNHLISLIPTPDAVQADHNSYATSYAGKLAGDPEKGKDCDAHRDAVNQSLTILLGLAKAVTVKDPKVPEILRLASAPKATATSGVLSQPTGFKVVYTPQGQLLGGVSKVENAKGYQIWACDDNPNVENNWRLVASSPSCKGILIAGLDRTKNNWLKIRAVKARGVVGPWSNFVNLNPS
jgi:hypothetical protein